MQARPAMMLPNAKLPRRPRSTVSTSQTSTAVSQTMTMLT